MKKTYKLENLDCANCAAKIEAAAAKIDGVDGLSVSFLTQRLTLDAQDNVFDDVLARVAKAVRKADPFCRLVSTLK